jgi:hypothetical protein
MKRTDVFSFIFIDLYTVHKSKDTIHSSLLNCSGKAANRQAEGRRYVCLTMSTLIYRKTLMDSFRTFSAWPDKDASRVQNCHSYHTTENKIDNRCRSVPRWHNNRIPTFRGITQHVKTSGPV